MCVGTAAEVGFKGLAQSGYVFKLNIWRPHVFIARATHKIPRIFITNPVFTWKTHMHTLVSSTYLTQFNWLLHALIYWLSLMSVYHISDQQVSRSERDWVGGCRNGKHESIWASSRGWNHEVQWIDFHTDGLKIHTNTHKRCYIGIKYITLEYCRILYNKMSNHV